MKSHGINEVPYRGRGAQSVTKDRIQKLMYNVVLSKPNNRNHSCEILIQSCTNE